MAHESLVELNVSGVHYTSTVKTLTNQPDSLLAKWFTPGTPESAALLKDTKGRYFIERDGQLFRYILDFLRSNGNLILPEGFCEVKRLQNEAKSLGVDLSPRDVGSSVTSSSPSTAATATAAALSSTGDTLTASTAATAIAALSMTTATNDPLLKPGSLTQFNPLSSCSNRVGGGGGASCITSLPSSSSTSSSTTTTCSSVCPGYISVGYRGSFAFGRDGLADVKFRKLTKILVCGKVSLCREVFAESLNESRDPDHGQLDLRYSARFFLKHTVLEQAFDALQEAGFHMVGSCASGTGPTSEPLKPGIDSEESRWNHYNEFIFCRP